jgi:hypothetical protein
VHVFICELQCESAQICGVYMRAVQPACMHVRTEAVFRVLVSKLMSLLQWCNFRSYCVWMQSLRVVLHTRFCTAMFATLCNQQHLARKASSRNAPLSYMMYLLVTETA